ncbi:hypothetical protein JCM8097_003627 [Rhodosporidiobolus ruineniae]
MASWLDLHLLRTAASYALSPAYFCSSLFWSTLGYSSSPDRLLTALTPTQRRLASPRANELEALTARAEGDARPSVLSLRKEDEDEVEGALREAMREADEDEREANNVDDVEEGVVQQRGWREENDSAFPPAPPFPPPVPTSNPTLSPLPASPPPPSSRHTLRSRPARPLNSISRLSRRSTICLTRLSAFYPPSDSSSVPGAPRTRSPLPDFSSPPTPANEALSPSIDLPAAEPSEAEKALLERLLGDELEEVTSEIARAVDSALELEGRRDEVVETDEKELEEEKPVEVERGREPSIVEREPAGSAFSVLEVPEEKEVEAERVEGSFFASPEGRCVRTRLLAHPSSSTTLEQLLASERKERKRPATESLVWLVRLLKFAATSFRFNLDSPTREELSVSISHAWDDEFSKYFNWLVRPLFKVLLRACPSRSLVYSTLSRGACTTAEVEAETREWVAQVEGVVAAVEKVVEAAGQGGR